MLTELDAGSGPRACAGTPNQLVALNDLLASSFGPCAEQRDVAGRTCSFRVSGQPIENSGLSSLHAALPTTGKSQQRLERIRGVVGRPTRKADGVEGSKDEVAQ